MGWGSNFGHKTEKTSSKAVKVLIILILRQKKNLTYKTTYQLSRVIQVLIDKYKGYFLCLERKENVMQKSIK